MKAVMYHYVRDGNADLPHFVYLHVDDFEAQLDHFQEHYHILGRAELLDAIQSSTPVPNGIVLTFDDGLSDHYDHVFPALRKRKLWGIFYVPTLPYHSKRLLDVHRTHYLLGKVGGQAVLSAIRDMLADDDLLPDCDKRYATRTYQKQENEAATQEVKRLINYYIKPARRTSLLDKAMNIFCEDEQALACEYYLSQHEILEMIDAGMGIGCHSHSHTLLSNLTREEQKEEIMLSKNIIKTMTRGNQLDSFCFPYGGSHSYNGATLSILRAEGFKFSFSVDSRDITARDLSQFIFELPRYDCNEFLHGKATKGVK